MAKIRSAALALKKFGPNGTHPIPFVRLVKKGGSSWAVQALLVGDDADDREWHDMCHYTSAAEVCNWANRF